MPKHIYPIINYATKYTEYSMLHLTAYHVLYTRISGVIWDSKQVYGM